MERGRDRIRIPDEVVAVGLLARDVLVADRAARTRSIEHDHVRAEMLRHALREEARRDVRRGAGGKEHRDLDVAALRIRRVLRGGDAGDAQRYGKKSSNHASTSAIST